jgi:ribosomal protein S6
MVRLSRRSMGEYRGCPVLVIICAKKRTKKRSRWLAKTLAKLHPAHRYVITSAYFRRQSITEIATRLGIPESDVRWLTSAVESCEAKARSVSTPLNAQQVVVE